MKSESHLYIEERAMAMGSEIGGLFFDLIHFHPEFLRWSGSHHPDAHHYGEGGLLRHTAEVIKMCFVTKYAIGAKVDDNILFLGALFHDTGKLFDYVMADDTYTRWVPAPHKRTIHHISRSGLIWHDCVSKRPDVYNRYHDEVLHVILSHHGQREFGSPVAPKSKEAWLVHFCDGISARMDDADRLDQIKVKA